MRKSFPLRRKAIKTLDAMIVLGTPIISELIKKTQKAVEVGERIGVGVYAGSGGAVDMIGDYPSQGEMIAEELRRLGIDDRRIVIEGESRNTVENVLYSLREIQGREIGVCSNSQQLDRTRMIINKGQRSGVIDKNLNFYRVETEGRLSDAIYEAYAGFLSRFSVQDDLTQVNAFCGIPGLFKKYAFDRIYRIGIKRNRK